MYKIKSLTTVVAGAVVHPMKTLTFRNLIRFQFKQLFMIDAEAFRLFGFSAFPLLLWVGSIRLHHLRKYTTNNSPGGLCDIGQTQTGGCNHRDD